MTSLSGIALITSVFGAAGAGTHVLVNVYNIMVLGMTTYRVANRVKDISEFFFIAHRNLRKNMKKSAEAYIRSQSPLHRSRKPGFWNKLIRSTETEQSLAGSTDDDITDTPASQTSSPVSISKVEMDLYSPPPFVTITISGWITKLDHVIECWQSLDPEQHRIFDDVLISKTIKHSLSDLLLNVRRTRKKTDDTESGSQTPSEPNSEPISTDASSKPNTPVENRISPTGYEYGEHYSLCWETSELLALARAIESRLTFEAAGLAAAEIMKQTFLAGVMAAMVWPAVSAFTLHQSKVHFRV